MLSSAEPDIGAPERSDIPLQGLSFWEQDLPWALTRMLQGMSKGKRAALENEHLAGRGPVGAC